jgi:hypothetical protein
VLLVFHYAGKGEEAISGTARQSQKSWESVPVLPQSLDVATEIGLAQNPKQRGAKNGEKTHKEKREGSEA